ncbi:MAG: putative Ig domain-containing protein [Halioglobus sp.]|nr:putative Ig domain-containing protein [Halioglobus sp.]
MSGRPWRVSPLERFLGLFTRLRPGEGRSVVWFFTYALLLMLSYYILKTIREPLLLATSSAEVKSYAYAVTAALLFAIVPLYGLVFRHTSKRQLTRYVTGFFLSNIVVFYLLGRAGVDIGFAYYVWVGVFSVVITAQFWAFAADSFNVKSGQRLFPLVMVGATLGGLAAPALSGWLFSHIGPWPLMLVATALLALTLPCVDRGRDAIPRGSRGHADSPDEPPHGGFWSGLSLVAQDRYLLLLAIMVVLLNWVNTSGEYILAELVVRHASAAVAADPGLDRGAIIARFYGNFFSVVNLLTFLLQLFVVARVVRWIGVRGAVLVLPAIACVGYGLVVFVPIFSILRIVKIAENATDYSLMNTVRHTLYLPLGSARKFEGKTAIEAFFWRFGDLIQAGAVYAGLHWLDFDVEQFALLNMCLAAIWLLVARQVGRHYGSREEAAGENLPPQLVRQIDAHSIAPGTAFAFALPQDTFIDPDEGDVLSFSASLENHAPLPRWIHFDGAMLAFSGTAPQDATGVTRLLVRATDFDGAWAEGLLELRHDA